MSAAIIAIIVIVAVVVLVISAMTMTRRRLQQRFGPEYDRVVGEKHGQFRAAAELTRRERRVQRLRIRPLTASARGEYAAEWRVVQEGFVDQPRHALIEGQDLLASVMKERGYPAEDAEQIAADLSVTHAAMLDHYRTAQQVSADAERGDASTEDLRQALLHLRALFGQLLGKPDDVEPMEPAEAGPRVPGARPAVSKSRVAGVGVSNGAGSVPDTATPDTATPDTAASDTAARDAPARDAALRGVVVRDDPLRDGAVRDGTAPGGPVRDGAAPESPVRADVAIDGAGTPESEEQLWRPGIRVPRARPSTEETTQ